MQKESLCRALSSVSRKMDDKCLYLVELDQRNGDGDLGISMKEGFKAAERYIGDTGERDLGRLMAGIAGAFNEAAPSSLGTILSIGMMGMAKTLKGKEKAQTEEVATALLAGIRKIMERAHSKPGEKTILDALYPAAEALKDNAEKRAEEAYAIAVEAARRGAESTKDMLPRHGRAAYYGEKSLGIVDGGAVAGLLILEGIYESVCR